MTIIDPTVKGGIDTPTVVGTGSCTFSGGGCATVCEAGACVEAIRPSVVLLLVFTMVVV